MMDAALRRNLLFALLGGQWLPPPEPVAAAQDEGSVICSTSSTDSDSGSRKSSSSRGVRRGFHRNLTSSFQKTKGAGGTTASSPQPFGPSIVAASSISFLEVLQVLTLQAHTLEECARLHQTHDMEEESRHLSSSLSVNTYLSRMIFVPPSLEDCWVLRCPDPLPSAGTGSHRGSILGLLIALYEHRSDHGASPGTGGEDDTSGGARALTADGLKWVLRFVGALVDGAPSVSAASQSAMNGKPIRGGTASASFSWSISHSVRAAIKGMLSNLPDLWPKEQSSKDPSSVTAAGGGDGKKNAKSSEARKAAQLRALEMMKKQQASFAASIDAMANSDGDVKKPDAFDGLEEDAEEENSCIICRCDDTDGDSNGPLGFLGHVQRSRSLQLRNMTELAHWDDKLCKIARVLGDKGCQLRVSEDMESAPIACLPTGSIVTILESRISDKYDLLSRRVRVQHVSAEKPPVITEGWASVQSSQGYVILSPLFNLCYSNTRWGSTRPFIRQCGHAAHLGCVDAHCASLHQRAAGEQPYDGRFSANIEEGEFLCPLCKQLSNILVPKGCNGGLPPRYLAKRTSTVSSCSFSEESDHPPNEDNTSTGIKIHRLRQLMTRGMQSNFEELYAMGPKISAAKTKLDKEREATRRFGAHLLQAMQTAWEKPVDAEIQKKKWSSSLAKWDYEDDPFDVSGKKKSKKEQHVGKLLRLLRQQHIAWATIGYGAASAEASVRGIPQILESENGVSPSSSSYIVADPWTSYDSHSRDSHPNLLELRRTLIATASLLDVFNYEMMKQSHAKEEVNGKMASGVTLIGHLIANIIEGNSGLEIGSSEIHEEWRALMPFVSSMPCHVARDGSLTFRHEARATAAEMWAVKGLGTTSSPVADTTTSSPNLSSPADDGSPRKKRSGGSDSSIPPTPLAVLKVCAVSEEHDGDAAKPPKLFNSWGTTDPCQAVEFDLKPFRPAVASSFLYIPLLAWDLNTFSGTLYSSLLLSNEPSNFLQIEDLVLATHTLLVARLVQVLVAPHGFSSGKLNGVENSNELSQVCDHWDIEQAKREGHSLKELQLHCLRAVNRLQDSSESISFGDEEALSLLHNAGLAILPYARSLILLLRACSSAVRRRNRQLCRLRKISLSKPSPAERALESVLDDSLVMDSTNGFQILDMLGGPFPSSLRKTNENGLSWSTLIDKWLGALVALEDHHGSRGKKFVYDTSSRSWVPSFAVGTNYVLKVGNKRRVESSNEEKKRPNNSNVSGLPAPVQGHDAMDTGVAQDSTKGFQSSDDMPHGENKGLAIEEGLQDPMADEESMQEEVSNEDNFQSTNVLFEASDDDEEDDEDEDEDYDVELNEVEIAERGRQAIDIAFHMLQNGGAVANDVDVSDDDAEMGEDDEILDGAADGSMLLELTAAGRRLNLLGDTQYPRLPDEASSVSSSSAKEEGASLPADHEFASMSRASIIPYQPSILGKDIGPGPRGSFFEYTIANTVMSDLSHLGMVHRLDTSRSGLIRLPQSFVELYSLVNKIKGRDNGFGGADEDDGSSSETAICLLTGAIMRSGPARRALPRGAPRLPGACTIHARKYGSGIGIFFLIQKCTVLLIHNNKSTYYASLYVDEHGEEDPGLRRGRPLFLKQVRYGALETLWRQHGVPREVAQRRSTSDRVIRDNWY